MIVDVSGLEMFKKLVKQVHRKGISEDRNNEMRDKILSIKKW